MNVAELADLVVLVADVQQEKTIETLLTVRQSALGIRAVNPDIYRHPRKDPGVYHEAADFLAPYLHSHAYSLVVIDAEWDGAPAGGAEQMRSRLLHQMATKGWGADRCQIIVLDPELEAWVWSTSNIVPDVLRTTWDEIHALARQMACWNEGQAKPCRPKELLESILRQQKRPRSSALFQELAGKVSLNSCQDTAFSALRDTLKEWFAVPTPWEQ